MIKIIIVDDHAVVRKGVIRIIAEKPDMYSVDEASSGDELLTKAKNTHYDVVLLDIAMPGKDGLDTLKILKIMYPNMQVLFFSMYPEDQYAVRLMKCGAAGYLNKDCEPDELLQAIDRVAQGLKYVSPKLSEILINSIDIGAATLHENLSDREFQVMCLLAKGKMPTQIADELSLSINTISTYRVRILNKLNLKNVAEITNYAIKNRLIE